jgi:hypothetical protein
MVAGAVHNGAAMFDWMRPPQDWMGSVVPLDLEVAVNERVCITITHLTAYPVGFRFGFLALTKMRPGVICQEALDIARQGSEDPDSLPLHFGVEFSDGRRADDLTSWINIHGGVMGRSVFPESFPPDPEQDLFLRVGGVSGSDRRFSGDGWIWPHPPQGLLTFWIGWPAADLPVQATRVDATPLLDAVSMAHPLWGSS